MNLGSGLSSKKKILKLWMAALSGLTLTKDNSSSSQEVDPSPRSLNLHTGVVRVSEVRQRDKIKLECLQLQATIQMKPITIIMPL